MKKTVLVTGAAGMLGSSLVPLLKEEYDVYSTDINIDKSMNFLDVRDEKDVFKTVKQLTPELVIHLAAETDLEKCELDPKHAFKTNTIGTHNVALACQKYNAVMVYVSTAGVFDGEKKEPYTEFDSPNPINVYGKSKFEGENIVKGLLNRYFIVRAGWMIGGGPEKDKKFVYKILKQIKQGAEKIYAVDDKSGTPTYAPDFSKVLIDLIKTNYFGTYHLVCKGEGTRYDVAKKILEIIGRKDIKVMPVKSEYFSDTYFAPRPRSEIMHNFMLELRRMNTVRPWQEALEEYITKYFCDYILEG